MSNIWAAVIGAGATVLVGLLAFARHLMGDPSDRRKAKCNRLTAELQSKCPHYEMVFPEGEMAMRPWFRTDYGTLMWYCTHCAMTLADASQVREWRQAAARSYLDKLETLGPKGVTKWYLKKIDVCQAMHEARKRSGCGSLQI